MKILNHRDDSLYDIYANYEIAKDLWEALEKEYLTEDAGTKKYVVEKFLEYQMEEDKICSIPSSGIVENNFMKLNPKQGICLSNLW